MSSCNRVRAAAARAKLTTAIRDFFLHRDYLEVETPILAPERIPESQIKLFQTVFSNPFRNDRHLYLLPSPELWMKRLLSRGFPSCFQISKCFRNAEQIGTHHNPEFSMLEWYTLNAGYLDSLELTGELVRSLSGSTGLPAVISMHDFFFEQTGIDLHDCGTLEELTEQAAKQGVESAGGTWEEVFNKIFLRYAEPKLADYPAVFLKDYPVQIPCLAKVKDAVWRERWELYLQGVEIANCYTEETDPGEVRKFIVQECGDEPDDNRRADHDFAEVCASMPPCSGVALGLDRLLMVLTGAKRIDEVLLFPFPED